MNEDTAIENFILELIELGVVVGAGGGVCQFDTVTHAFIATRVALSHVQLCGLICLPLHNYMKLRQEDTGTSESLQAV